MTQDIQPKTSQHAADAPCGTDAPIGAHIAAEPETASAATAVASADAPGASTASRRRRRARTAAIALLFAALAVGGTVAFTTTEGQADNILTFGNVGMKVMQSEPDGEGGYAVLDPSQYDIKAPMGLLERRVQVKNTGMEPAYVRVQLDMEAQPVDGDAKDAAGYVEYGLNLIDPEGQAAPDADAEFTVGWTAGEDGWYYYNAPVASGEVTEPLVTSIELVGDFNGYVGMGGKYVFTADGQAVQQEHNGDTALEAQGWPVAADNVEGQE